MYVTNEHGIGLPCHCTISVTSVKRNIPCSALTPNTTEQLKLHDQRRSTYHEYCYTTHA